jgi:hypothetical protein
MPVEIILQWPGDFKRAHSWIDQCRNQLGTRVQFHPAKRTLPQNDRMWAMLTDIARQLDWHGLKLETEDWKLLFLDSLKREMRLVPNLDGTGFVAIDKSRSSKLSKTEFSNLIELIFAFGANHNIVWSDPDETGQRKTRLTHVAD